MFSCKMKKQKQFYYNNQEVVIAYQSDEIEYVLVYYKSNKQKTKFKVNLTELKNEKDL